jgi:uncharacterized membrane protein
MTTLGRILGFIGLASAGLVLGLLLLLFAIRLGRHLAWAIERRRERSGRGGDVLEALARKVEGRSL